MDIKTWSTKLQQLRSIILLPENTEETKQFILELHKEVHVSEVSGSTSETMEDLIWHKFNEQLFRTATDSKGRNVLYGIWHSARIEDITLNLLVAGKEQLFETQNWQSKIKSPIKHTGNSLNKDEILAFSKSINIEALKAYRIAVGKNTRQIVSGLQAGEFNEKVIKQNLPLILEQQAVDNVESANWLIDFWGRKNKAGIILMPALRHNLTHINESLRIIKKKKS
jgi:hypothetical protein